MHDLIFVSLENWDDVWRRNQHLCALWLRRFPGMRLLFVERSRDVSHAFRSGTSSGLRGPALREVPGWPGLTVFRPLKWLPNSLAPCRRLNSLHLLHQLRAAARAARLSTPLLWINDHFAEPLAGRLGEKGVVYDITDDWTLMPSISESERGRIRCADGALCVKADLVIVCSQALEHSRRRACRRLVSVPNGVDLAGYPGFDTSGQYVPEQQPSFAKEDPATPGLPSKRRPVFGYVGTLHSDRLDLDLVSALAAGFPEAQVVLCGPNLLNDAAKARLKALENVELRAPVPHTSVPRLLSSFDVNILPHRCSPFTESLNPIKLWEYMASGRPIAATPVAGFREYSRFCHLGQEGAGFVRACREALLESPCLALERRREAAKHSWNTRMDAILAEFEELGWIESAPDGIRRSRPGNFGFRSRRCRGVSAVDRGDFRRRNRATGHRRLTHFMPAESKTQTSIASGV